MSTGPYVYLWSFDIASGRADEFERVYGPEGDWVALFRRAPGYRSTRLLRDRERPGRYVTIDEWESAEAFDAFRRDFAAEFEALDRRCEALTADERSIGRFDALDRARGEPNAARFLGPTDDAGGAHRGG